MSERNKKIIRNRHEAREIILTALYQMDLNNAPLEEILKFKWVENEIAPNIKEFIKEIITGTYNNIEKIDKLIKRYSENWSFDRISPIDKAILRFSIYSLLYRKDIPYSVTIDEAIEISKKYGSEKSYQFINGVLDGIKNNELKTESENNS